MRHDPATWCYFLMGAVVLAPWNAFLTAIDYFALCYGPHMDRLFTICYLPMCLAVLLLMLHLGPRAASLHTRITAGFSGFIAVTLLVPLVDKLLVGDQPQAPPLALYLVLGAVLATGVLDGVCQGAMFVDAARAGQQYTHAAIGGTACSGVLICLLRIVTKATFPSDAAGLRSSTAVYFAAATVLSGAGLAVHLVALPRLGVRPVPAALSKAGQGASRVLEMTATDSRLALANAGAAVQPPVFVLEEAEGAAGRGAHEEEDEEDDDLPVTQAVLFSHLGGQRYMPVNGALAGGTGAGGSLSPGHTTATPWFRWWSRGPQQQQQRSRRRKDDEARLRYARLPRVALRCWPSLSCLVVTYIATLSVFPGVLAEDVHSQDLGSWLPILLISLFNVADAAGKLAPIWPAMWLQHQSWLLGAALARVVLLLPALVLAVAFSIPMPAIALLTALFGLTNGYVTALAMTLAPSFAVQEAGHAVRTWTYDEEERGASGAATRNISGYESFGKLGRSDSGGGLPGLPPSPKAVTVRRSGSPRAAGAPAGDRTGGGTAASAGASGGWDGHSSVDDGHTSVEPCDADVAEDLCVVSLVTGLTLGAFLAWAWLLVPHSNAPGDGQGGT